MAATATSSTLSSLVVPPSVAPIDIQLPKAAVSTAGVTAQGAATTTTTAVGALVTSGSGESLGGDSGYESSWPSLSEAAAWSSAQTGARKGGGGHPSHLHAHHHRCSFDHSPTIGSSPDMSGSSSGDGPGAAMLHYHPHHRQRSNAHQPQCQPIAVPAGKKYKHRRRRAQALQAMEQPYLEPLVDFGSPVMDEVDMVHHQELPIPLSAIPRRWLYEEDEASGDDDILVTVPKREWVYCPNSALSMDAKSFVVMSWNLLSPRLCHPLRLHHRCNQAHLEWNTRRETILHQIVFMDADIICLQELEKQDFDEYFDPQLARLGYKSIHAYKTNLYETRDGCALFYRDSRFKLNDHHILRYNQTDLDDEKRPSMARDTAIRFNLFHNLAIVALLENRRTHRLVQVATTHLLADPAYPDAKMLQSAILVSKLEELKAKALAEYGHCGQPATHAGRQHSHTHHCYHPAYYRPMARLENKHPRASTPSSSSVSSPTPSTCPSSSSSASSSPTCTTNTQHFKPCPALDIPTVIAGDFNSLPHSSVINFLKTGRVETSHFGGYDFGRFTRKAHKYLHHSLELTDCYKDSTLPCTNVTRNFEGTIDYMLFAEKSLSLVGYLDHLERPPAPATASIAITADKKNKKAAKEDDDGGGGGSGRSKKKKKKTVAIPIHKDPAETHQISDRLGPTDPLTLSNPQQGKEEVQGEDVDGDDDDHGLCISEGSDSEEPTMSSDSHGEMSGLGDDDSSGSDADQESMQLGLRSSFTPTTIWSSLTPLQQQRLTLASRTFSSDVHPTTTTTTTATKLSSSPGIPATGRGAGAKSKSTHLHHLATSTTTTTTTSAAAEARYPLPTMPSQYFPSDHIPLAAVFKERDMTVCCCSQSCRRRTDDPKL